VIAASGSTATLGSEGEDIRLVVGLVLLVGLAVAALTVAGVRLRRDVATAALRAAVQLAVVGAVIGAVLRAPALAAALLGVMYTVSVATAARRLDRPGALAAVAIASVAALIPVLGIAFAVPVVPRSARYVVALGGIVLGNTMVACTLTGRGFWHAVLARRDEVEAWLALGATPREACRPMTRTAIREAMLPSLDQTRTVGLVTLPGAFVGALAGGAGAGAAARFQLVVLVTIVAAQACSATVLTWLIGAPTQIPLESGSLRRPD
jgi:putative ABC transport system permease protein